MASRRVGKKVKYGNSISLSFTLDELNENVSTVAIERVSADGRRIHRRDQHVVPSPKKRRVEVLPLDDVLNHSGDGLFSDDADDSADVGPEDEKIKPRAKRYLSAVYI
jgi:hypothetical protein